MYTIMKRIYDFSTKNAIVFTIISINNEIVLEGTATGVGREKCVSIPKKTRVEHSRTLYLAPKYIPHILIIPEQSGKGTSYQCLYEFCWGLNGKCSQ